MAIVFKAIKPKRFRQTAFVKEFAKEAQVVGNQMERAFKKTTRTWKHKVKFDKVIAIGPKAVEVLVSTDDQIYRWVSDGTKPHPIFAGFYTGRSNKKALVFPSKFRPKTKVRVIGSSRGMKGGQTVFTPAVQHPGTEARRFDEEIQKRFRKRFKRRMEAAMRRAVQKSGHKKR